LKRFDEGSQEARENHAQARSRRTAVGRSSTALGRSSTAVGPLGSSVGTVSLDGNPWTLYAGSNGSNPTYSFVRSGNESSGTVNLLDLLKYLENTKKYFSNPTLSTIQYGWEISGTGNTQLNFTMNSYSASTS
jgi:hypothetical protein